MARLKTPGNIITVYGCINNDNNTIAPTKNIRNELGLQFPPTKNNSIHPTKLEI
jgi:hypothetical protein